MKNSISSVNYKDGKIYIDIKINNLPKSTRDLPATLTILKKHLPSIFSNKCFNPKGLSFYKEVQNTETAHLLEHIILEIMCLKKLENAKSAVYEGRTFWDTTNPTGNYQICVTAPLTDWPIFASALSKGCALVEQIAERSGIKS